MDTLRILVVVIACFGSQALRYAINKVVLFKAPATRSAAVSVTPCEIGIFGG